MPLDKQEKKKKKIHGSVVGSMANYILYTCNLSCFQQQNHEKKIYIYILLGSLGSRIQHSFISDDLLNLVMTKCDKWLKVRLNILLITIYCETTQDNHKNSICYAVVIIED